MGRATSLQRCWFGAPSAARTDKTLNARLHPHSAHTGTVPSWAADVEPLGLGRARCRLQVVMMVGGVEMSPEGGVEMERDDQRTNAGSCI